MDFFEEVGCKISDHGLEYIMFEPATEEEIEAIFAKRLAGEMASMDEMRKFKTAYMIAMGKAYSKKGWAMQLHYGAKRDNNQVIYKNLGPDTGVDCINTYAPSAEMADYLNALAVTDELPKTIIYSLNPTDNAAIGTIIGCFQGTEAIGKIQQGSGWWFNDNIDGMEAQMKSLANLASLGNFLGMLTDSRSFMSYPRHEYFRRILCNIIGKWVENGLYPDISAAAEIVRRISYYNAVKYFGFNI
jgi:glucuronate isomerase